MEQLRNPVTQSYLQLKNLCRGGNFPCYYNDSNTEGLGMDDLYENFGFWGYSILRQTEDSSLLPRISPEFYGIFDTVLNEIFVFNNITVQYVFRVNLNITTPTEKNLPCYPHVDHDFPHKNLLIYLNDSDGDTVEESTNSRFTPKEDDVIVFSGSHYHHPPTSGRRIVIICTYM